MSHVGTTGKLERSTLENALKEVSKQQGVVLHVCSKAAALQATSPDEITNGRDVREGLRGGRFPIWFHLIDDLNRKKLVSINQESTIVQCRFALVNVFPEVGDVNDFHFVHEGIIFPPAADEGNFFKWCLANLHAQGLPIQFPVDVAVISRSRAIRLQRCMLPEGTLTAQSDPSKQCTVKKALGKAPVATEGSTFMEHRFAVLPTEGSTFMDYTWKVSSTEALQLLSKQALSAALPELKNAYFTFESKSKLLVLSELRAQSSWPGACCPAGIFTSGRFFSFDRHGEESFEELGIGADDVVHLRFSLPLASSGTRLSPAQAPGMLPAATHPPPTVNPQTFESTDRDWEFVSTTKHPRFESAERSVCASGTDPLKPTEEFMVPDLHDTFLSVVQPQSADISLAVGDIDPEKTAPNSADISITLGGVDDEKKALDLAEKIVACGLDEDFELCSTLAQKARIEEVLLKEMILRVTRRAYNTNGADGVSLFGFNALAHVTNEILKRVEMPGLQNVDILSLMEQQGPTTFGGDNMAPSHVEDAWVPVLPVTVVGKGAAERRGKLGEVWVESVLGQSFAYRVADCRYALGVKLRLMAEAGTAASTIKLSDAQGRLVLDYQELDQGKSYYFIMAEQCEAPDYANGNQEITAEICREANLCSDIFTATLEDASHVCFLAPSSQPKIIVHEPFEYFCPDTTTLVYWDPVFQMWGTEQLLLQAKGQVCVTVQHFSSFAFRSMGNNVGIVVDADAMFDPHFDFDFTHDQDMRPFTRGGLEYQRPTGWERYAVNVLGRYDQGSNRWLSKHADREAWPVAYHATTPQNWAAILRGRGVLQPGPRQRGSPSGRSIYLSKDPVWASNSFATRSAPMMDIHGRRFRYKVMYQARVRPGAYQEQVFQEGLRQTREPRAWLFENAEDIRIYGLCVRVEYV